MEEGAKIEALFIRALREIRGCSPTFRTDFQFVPKLERIVVQLPVDVHRAWPNRAHHAPQAANGSRLRSRYSLAAIAGAEAAPSR